MLRIPGERGVHIKVTKIVKQMYETAKKRAGAECKLQLPSGSPPTSDQQMGMQTIRAICLGYLSRYLQVVKS